jgi:hypothetical protein
MLPGGKVQQQQQQQQQQQASPYSISNDRRRSALADRASAKQFAVSSLAIGRGLRLT